MPIDRARIDQTAQRWLLTFETRGASASSLKVKRIVTDALKRVAAAEDVIYLRDLRPHHFDAALADLARGIGAAEIQRRAALAAAYPGAGPSRRRRVETYSSGGPRTGRSPATLVGDQRHLRQFVAYCQGNNWIAQSFHPFSTDSGTVYGNGDASGTATTRRRVVRYNEWNRLLDAADGLHPRTRMLIAMGLYWGRRVSEASLIQWGHINDTDVSVDRSDLTLSYEAVDIGPGEAVIRNVKRRRTIAIPIGGPMLLELERWRTWMEKTQYGPVQPEWHVLPARIPPVKLHAVGSNHWAGPDWPVAPTRKAGTGALIQDVQKALVAFGWRDVRGEGMHTLRRSVAAHLDSLGHIAAAQALLDHMHRHTTELYSSNRAGESDLRALMQRDNPYEA